MPHINYALRQAGHSDTVADELTRALGLLAAHGVVCFMELNTAKYGRLETNLTKTKCYRKVREMILTTSLLLSLLLLSLLSPLSLSLSLMFCL